MYKAVYVQLGTVQKSSILGNEGAQHVLGLVKKNNVVEINLTTWLVAVQ